MQELLELFPGAQRALFRRYHIGGCSSCGFSPSETLSELCARNNQLPVAEVIAFIEQSHDEDLRTQISPRELRAHMDTGRPYQLLDIRTREEFETAHIDDSHLFTQELMQEILGKWDRGDLVAVIDHRGARSMDAAAYLAGHGFTNVKSLAGGLDAWSSDVDPAVPRYELEHS